MCFLAKSPICPVTCGGTPFLPPSCTSPCSSEEEFVSVNTVRPPPKEAHKKRRAKAPSHRHEDAEKIRQNILNFLPPSIHILLFTLLWPQGLSRRLRQTFLEWNSISSWKVVHPLPFSSSCSSAIHYIIIHHVFAYPLVLANPPTRRGHCHTHKWHNQKELLIPWASLRSVVLNEY